MNQQVSVMMRASDLRVKSRATLPRDKIRLAIAVALVASDTASLVAGYFTALALFGISAENLPFAKISLAFFMVNGLFSFAFRSCTGRCLVKISTSVARATTCLALALMFMSILSLNFNSHTLVAGAFLPKIFATSLLFMVVLRCVVVSLGKNALKGELYSVLVLSDGKYPTSIGDGLSVDLGSTFDPAQASAEDYHRLAGILSTADRVVLRCSKEKRDVWTHVLQGMNVHVEIIAPEMANALALGRYAGRPTYVVAKGPLNLRDRLIKRGFDIVVSAIALLALSPMMIFIAIAIKLESPGPVFFVQNRIGRQNRLFKIYKFRSMFTERCDLSGSRSASRDDDRVTRVGRLIRRTSIDELPQLLNVLFGTMSVVGPRPHAANSTALSKLFWEVDSRYWHRHACKPGITGLAQVRGFRGATLIERDLTDRLNSDLEYLANWSLWDDLMIVARTLAVLVHKNAF